MSESNAPKKRLFFSTEGLDFSSDEAIEVFAQKVWAEAIKKFKEQDIPHDSNNTDHQGETHE